MHKVNYRPGKLMLSAAASLLVALWLGYGWSPDDNIVWIAGAALFAYLAFASIRTAIGDRPAIAYDTRQVTINTLHRSTKHDWHEVGDVLTLHNAPDQVTAMVSVDFDDAISAQQVETIVHRIEQEAAARWPMVRRMFIRPQSGAGSFAPGAAWTNHR